MVVDRYPSCVDVTADGEITPDPSLTSARLAVVAASFDRLMAAPALISAFSMFVIVF